MTVPCLNGIATMPCLKGCLGNFALLNPQLIMPKYEADFRNVALVNSSNEVNSMDWDNFNSKSIVNSISLTGAVIRSLSFVALEGITLDADERCL